MSKQSFIKGTMILLAAGMINRILGFVPRIVLPRLIGAEGVGLYQMGYPFLLMLITIVTGGLPLAIAKLVSEAESLGDEARIKSILRVSIILAVIIGIFFTFICLWATPWITTYLLTDSRVYYTFITLCPIIAFISIAAVLRGYFQGRQNMIPTAVSQVTETAVRSVMVLLLAYILLPYGLEYAAAGAMGGVLIGEIIGLIVLYIHFHRHRKQQLNIVRLRPSLQPELSPSTLRHLLRIAIPVTASKLVGSLSYFWESIMIVQSLAIAGVATQVATAQYGALTGMVVPILLIPGALTYSLAVSLVPALSEAAAKHDMPMIHKRLHQSLKLSLVAGAPFVVVMFVLAKPLCTLLFNDASIAGMLKMMAPVAMFIYFQAPLQATLQALDRPNTALLNTFIGAAIKLILIFVLAAHFKLGIIGAVIAMCINTMLVTWLHSRSIKRLLGFSMRWEEFIKTGCAMLFMAVACTFVMYQINLSHLLLSFPLACLTGAAVYILAIFLLKLVDKNDFVRIPGFTRIFGKAR